MNFLLTRYFYPLSAPVDLSLKARFTFDNPRTQRETDDVKTYLTDLYDSPASSPLPLLPIHSEENVVTLESIIGRFADAFVGADDYAERFFRSYDRRFVFDCFAKMWVIARFDDEGTSNWLETEAEQMRQQGQRGGFLLEDDHPIIKNSDRLVSYCHLLSLLSHTDGSDYFGRSFLHDFDPLSEQLDVTHDLMMLVGALASYRSQRGLDGGFRWLFWPTALGELKRNAQLLETAFENGLADKLLYIGGILRTASQMGDPRVRLVMLTSIIELLLTHSPDVSRFNIEDSIMKQFQLKASVLVYLNDKSRDIGQIKRRLRVIYQQRSNVAHGNFGELDAFVRKLPEREGRQELFDDLLVDLYVYVRAVLEEYLSDRQLVDFLKDA